jgi:hypothetical protein
MQESPGLHRWKWTLDKTDPVMEARLVEEEEREEGVLEREGEVSE